MSAGCLSTLTNWKSSMRRPARLTLATLKINGEDRTYEAPDDTPLLRAIREKLKLTGTKFGCGVGLCGVGVVHVDGKRAKSTADAMMGQSVQGLSTGPNRRLVSNQ